MTATANGSERARITILVCEDSDLYRRGLIAVLDDRSFDVVGTALTTDETVLLAGEHLPDVVLLDVELADGDSISSIARVHEVSSESRVVVLSPAPNREIVLRALRAGASGLLGKDQSPEGLERALRGLFRGEAPLPRQLASVLVDEVRREDRRRELAALVPDRDHLTPRQLEILKMLADGASTVGVASELFLSVETVRWHIKSILRKLGVNSRADAIACLEELQAV